MDIPKSWFAGEFVPGDRRYDEPPPSTDPRRYTLIGLIDGDPGHRYYDVPIETTAEEIVRVFRVGSHGAQSYGDDEDETVELVASKAKSIEKLIPCRPIFADAAGLKLKFLRKITEKDLAKIEKLFPDEESMQAGLEGYVAEWDGEGRLLERVLKENLLNLWWD
jgi:hypothetical protein